MPFQLSLATSSVVDSVEYGTWAACFIFLEREYTANCICLLAVVTWGPVSLVYYVVDRLFPC